ncbi:MAG: hypothetical protein K1X31_01625 [Gemmatimonadaceae bacterium]|nr:hypothetical protein [Gemmatimonadaceae bacterium]
MSLIRSLSAFAVLATLAACNGDPVGPSTALSADAASRTASAPAPAGAALTGRTIIFLAKAETSPYAGAKGAAKYDVRKPSKPEFEIEVEHLPAGTAVDFYLGDVKIGSATADSMGEANLELAAERGQTVPVPTGGTIAQARLADGRVLVSGSF